MASELRRDMLLKHSLRESGSPIEVMARDKTRGHLCTVDGAAIRLWGPNRQLKAHHIAPESKEASLRPLCVFFVSKYDRYIIVWSIKRRLKDDDDNDDEEQAERGGLIQVWDSAMLLQQEVPIMQLPLKQYALCLERLQFMLVDVDQTCILMQIDHLMLKKAGKASYQGGKGRKSAIGGDGGGDSVMSDGNLKLRLYFNEIQRIPMANDEVRVVDSIFINKGDYLFVLTHGAINCYNAFISYPQGESVMSTSIYEGETSASPQGTAPIKFDDGDDSDNNGYKLSSKFYMPFLEEGISPVSFLHLGNRRFVIGKSDGGLQVRYIDHARDFENPFDAQSIVLSDISGHSVDSDFESNPVALCSCVGWSSVAPGGHEYEFLSIGGSDNKIKLWGLRSGPASSGIGENDFSSVYSAVGVDSLTDVAGNDSQYDSYLEVLGTFDAITEPPTKLTLRKYRKFWSGKAHACTFELQSRKNSPDFAIPIRRRLVVCFGGMLAFIEAYHIYKETLRLGDRLSDKKLCAFNQGPPLSLVAQNDPSGHFQKSILVLGSNDIVSVINPIDGQLLRQYNCLYVADTTKTSFNRMGEDSLFYSETRAREGKPSCVYWDGVNQAILVGYSNGGVNYVGIDHERDLHHVDIFSAHDSAIERIYVFRNSPKPGVVITYLLVGDAKGKLTVWQISGPRKSQRLVWSTEAHTGAIVYANGLLTNGDHLADTSSSTANKMIVTACVGGVVKVWLQHDNGELMLSSFFRTRHGNISSFHPTLVVVSPEEDHQGTVDGSDDHAGSRTVLSALIRSIDGSAAESSEKRVTKTMAHLICICGLQNGMIECWVLSNSDNGVGNNSYVMDSQSAIPVIPVQVPQWILPVHEAPIVSIMRLRDTYEDLLHSGNHVYLAMNGEGSAILMHMTVYGELIRQRGYFSLPTQVDCLLPCSEYGDRQYDEFYACCEQQVLEFSATSADSILSTRWARLRRGENPAPAPTGKNEIVPVPLSEFQDSEIIDQGEDLSDGGISESKGEPISGDDMKDVVNGSIESAYREGSLLLDGGDETLFADSMISMDKAVTADLHFAKKDSRLISLFQQSDKISNNQVSCEVALEIVLKWLNKDDEETIKPETIWETMLLLAISREDRLSFTRVAKVAALCSKVTKRKLKEDLAKLGMSEMKRSSLGSYKNMRKRKSHVVFNHLGETSIESVDFVDSVASGNVRGNCVAYHESWKNQGSRVLDHMSVTSSHQDQTHTRLRRIPPYFADHFKSKFLTRAELPASWNSDNPHWLDQRRTIRITRSLLDMRCARQHELVFNVARGNGSATTVESLSRLTCVYFERVFGHARLNVSHFKIVHFLEACKQYISCPVINLMQLFLCPESPQEEPSDLVMWMYIELRYFMMANGLMIDGPAVAANDIAGFVGMNNTGSQESGQLRWQLVSRDNARLAIDEMIRKRGKFGHECVKRLLESVDAIASVDLNNGSDDESMDIIDMEGFLYVVAYEFNKIEHLVIELERILFSLRQFPPFRVTTSRDIFHELAENVPVNIPARNANISLSLDRIKSLMYQFVHNDPRRTGTLDQFSFRSVVVVAGQAILGFDQGRDAHKLVDESVRLFRDLEDPDGRICYADLVGQLIAYLVMQQGGTCGLGGTEALAALKDLAASGIGIGEKQASAMVMMIGLMQCPPDTFPFWTTGVTGNEDQEQMQKSISKIGMWSVKEKNLPLDQSFSAQSIVEGEASVASEALTAPAFPGMEVKQMKLKNTLDSMSLAEEDFKKSFMTLDQESSVGMAPKQGSRATQKAPKKEPALITQSEILLDEIEPLSVKDGGYNPVTDHSYSKTIQNVSLSKSTTSIAPPQALDMNTMAMHESYSASVQRQSIEDIRSRKSRGPKSGTSSPVTASASAMIKKVPNSLDKLAADEVDIMRSMQVDEEQEMLRMIEIEQERFGRKRQAKESLMTAFKAEARTKEKRAMRFKAREDRLRYERVAAGKASYGEALRLQKEDINKKYAAIIKRQEEEKERVRLIKEKKRAIENAAKEKEREVQESITMRAADKFSAELEAFIKAKEEEERKKQEAEALQREKEEAAKREKERKAEEARAAAAAAKAQKEAEEAAEREEQNRRAEEKLFRAEDFNILSLPTEEELAAAAEQERLEKEEADRAASRASSRAKSRSSVRAKTPGTPAGGEIIGEDEEGDFNSEMSGDEAEEVQPQKELSAVEQRMVYFLERMKVAKDRNSDHPRKSDDKMQYFMPMLFSNDIKYKNFETPIDDEEGRLGKWNPKDVGKKHTKTPNPVDFNLMEASNHFGDISEAVKEHKVKLVQDRLKRLYRTSGSEESPADWTEVVKKDAVAWVEFLDAQEAILMEKPPTPPPPVDEEAEFFKELKMSALFLQDVEEEEEMSIPGEIPYSLPVPSDAAIKNISPLPLGHVASGIIQPDSYAYYQLEILDLCNLTLEVKSIRGYCDLYLSKNELPTKFNYEHRVHGGEYNHRIARLAYEPKELGTHFLGVHSDAGAKFEVWCFASGAGAAVAQPLKVVSNKLRQWEIVSNHTVEEIDMKLPELMNEAKKIVAFENSMAMPSILSDYKKNEGRKSEDVKEDDEDSDMDEVDIMDTFISKAGRRLIRDDLHAGACSITKKDFEEEDESSDEEPDHIDPNSHPELFKKPELKTRKEYMSIIRAEPKLGADDINDFLNASMSDRSRGLTLSQSLTSLPDLKKSLRARSLTSKSQSRSNMFQETKPGVVKLPPFMTKKISKIDYSVSKRVKESRGDIVRRERQIEKQAKGDSK